MPLKEIPIDPQTQKRKLYYWAISEDRLSDFEDWLEKLDRNVAQKLAKLLRNCFSHTEPLLHRSSEKFRKELDHKNLVVWAIKSGQLRLYGVRAGLNYHLLYFGVKKTQRLSAQEAKNIRLKCDLYLVDKSSCQ